MSAHVSRRRLLSAAGALAAGGFLAPGLDRLRVWGQPVTPEQALTRLFSADQFDPSWFSPALLEQVPLDRIQQALKGLDGVLGAFQTVTATDNDQYLVQFSGGTARLRVRFDGQLRVVALTVTGLSYALAPDEQEISFTSGSDTLYGTLLLPDGAANPPAALLIAGSGPTDRNGNSPLLGLQVNTLAGLARALADAGVASLRYDKLGAGKTGPGAHAPGDFPTVATFLDEARAAYAALTVRPEVDSTRTLVAGHSEGGLFAVLLARQVQLSGLLLAAPLGTPILDVLRRQLLAQDDQALAEGQLTQEQHDRLSADLDATISSIRANGTIPEGVFADAPQVLTEVFSPGTVPYLQDEDRYDPADLAAQLPISLPVLVLHGDLDANVVESELQHLLGGFEAAGNTGVRVAEFAGVDHELRQLPPGQSPDLTVAYPFSPAVAGAVTAFATTATAA